MQFVVTAEAQKQYSRIPKSAQTKVKKKLNLLKDNPLIGKKLEGELSSFRSLRSWPYRIIYKINYSDKRIEVVTILHRQGSYR